MAVVKLLLAMPIDNFAEGLFRTVEVLIMPGNYFRLGFGKKNLLKILQRFDAYLHRER